MYELLINRAFEAFRSSKDRDSLLRLLFLECRGNLTVLTAILASWKRGDQGPSDEQLSALSKSLSTEALGSIFVMGAPQDGALARLRKVKISEDDPEKPVSDTLANVYVRAQAVKRLAELRGAGFGSQVDFKRRLRNLEKDYLAIIKAMGEQAWKP